MSRTFWITWLTIILIVVLLYSLLLVVAGGIAGSLFDVLGFGPPASIDSPEVRDYLRLPYMVLGAVMAGWSLLMLFIVRGPFVEGSAWAPRALIVAVGLWFVLDTGMSLALGFPAGALGPRAPPSRRVTAVSTAQHAIVSTLCMWIDSESTTPSHSKRVRTG